jgi:phosphoribosylaminoimidazolecarboxamide formyltransferase/IMP cyclohydrolase
MKALISVFEKDNVIEFAQALHELGIEIIATEGTAQLILKNKIPVTKVSTFTGVPEMVDVKVKTLHPRIHAGIATGEIEIIAVNLVPPNPSSEKPLDSMDIGGVALIRSGIKNFERVTVIINLVRFTEIVEELRVKGHIARGTKLRLAKEASHYIVAYESTIDEIVQRLE